MNNPQTHPGRKSRTASRAQVSAAKTTISRVVERRGGVTDTSGAEITAEERHRRIAEAAYYRFAQGFHGGADLEDWLESEAEIDKFDISRLTQADADQSVGFREDIRAVKL